MSTFPTNQELKEELQKLAAKYKEIITDATSDKPKSKESAGDQVVNATVDAAKDLGKKTLDNAATKAGIEDGKWSKAGSISGEKKGSTAAEGTKEKTVDTSKIDKVKATLENATVKSVLNYLEKYADIDFSRPEINEEITSIKKGVEITQKTKVNIEWNNLLKGLKILAQKEVIAAKNYKINKEFEGKLGKAEIALNAMMKAFATAKADIEVLNVKTGTLINAKANAEAQVKAEAKLTAKHQTLEFPLGKVLTEAEIEAFAKAGAKAEGEIYVGVNGIEGKINLGADATIGIEAKGQIALNNKSGENLIILKGNASADLGAKATLKAHFSIKNGKLVLSFQAGAAFGIGGTVGGEVELNVKAIWNTIVNAINTSKKSFFEKIRAVIAKITTIAKTVKSAVVNTINNVVEKIKKIKSWFTSKKDALNKDKVAKLEAELKKAESIAATYENNVKAIKDDARAKVLANLSKAEKDLNNINIWADKVITGAKVV